MLALIVFRTQNIEWIRGITLTPSRVLFVHNLDQGLLGILRPRFEDVSNIPVFISSLEVLNDSSIGAKFVSDLIPSLGGRILEWVTCFSHEDDEAWQPSDDTEKQGNVARTDLLAWSSVVFVDSARLR